MQSQNNNVFAGLEGLPSVAPAGHVSAKREPTPPRKINTPESRPPTTQAERVIKKFGNARKLAAILDLDPTTVYRWLMPASKRGTDGRIPSDKLERIMAVARIHGVLLTDDDISPRRLPRPWVRAGREA